LQNGLSVTRVHTNEEVTQIDPDSIVDFVSLTSPVLNPDESLDRGTGINVETLATEVGSTLTTENLSNSIIMTPQTFTGFVTFIDRRQDNYDVTTDSGTLTLASIPSAQSVTGTINLPNVSNIIDLGSTNSYSTVDEFDVALASMNGTSLISTSHIVSASDTQNDYFSWGEWEIVPDTTIPTDRFVHGYWAAGVETPVSVIDGFRTALAVMTYSGNVIGEVQTADIDRHFETSNAITSGTANITVDFGANTFNATFDFSAGDHYVLTYDGIPNSNKLTTTSISDLHSDTESLSPTGALNGGFYGSDGKTVGGTFNAASYVPSNASNIYIQGAFKATETANINAGMPPP
jgi:hypothetical protein